jgi:hypothetical protein
MPATTERHSRWTCGRLIFRGSFGFRISFGKWKAHPSVQAELARQQRDLRELRGISGEVRDVVATWRSRAADEAKLEFDPVS